MATDDINALLNAGIQAAKAGNKQQARRYLEQVLEKDDNSETAWMWLASVVDTPRERRICLENVLEINPGNVRARQALEKLGPSPAAPKPQSAKPESPTPPATGPLSSPPLDRLASARPGTVPRSGPPPVPAANRKRQSRTISTPLFIAGIIGAVALIALGVFLLVNQGTPEPTLTSTPEPQTTAAVANAPTATIAPTIAVNAVVVTYNPNLYTSVPTWTPLPSATSLPTATPTATLPPLSNYTLVFLAERRSHNTPDIYTMRADGGAPEQSLVVGTAPALDLAVAPNGKLAYVSGSPPQIVVANADGSQPQPITTLTAKTVESPAWSPDSKTIAFSSDQTDSEEIYTIAADGTNLTRITTNKIQDKDPFWSPDGKSLVFASDMFGQKSLQLYLMDLSTKKTTQLTQSTNSNYSPAISPDGKAIAFVSTRDGYPNVYTMNADGSNPQLLSIGAASSNNLDPAWSPDGQYIAFASDRNQQVFNVFITTPDGRTVQQVTNQTSNSYSPRFRPK